MKDLEIFVNLTRLNRPIGYLLLFWPCSWGLAYAYYFNDNLEIFLSHIVLFFLGAVLMRSAGCIVNDIVDRKLDKKVKRTKNRPLAANLISVQKAFFYVTGLCGLAFFILIQFNFLTIILGLASMSLAFSYPFMKRVTYWPQLFLGLTFNWGIIMAWASISNYLTIDIFIVYFAAIFWTLGYDTVYGFQDIKDDEIIGLKSTSIKFKNKPYTLLISCYIIFLSSLLIVGYSMKLNEFSLIVYIFIFIQMFYYQMLKLNVDDPLNCLKVFKSNNYLGFFVLFGLLIGKI